MLCIAAHKTFNQNIIITRSSNNYGPFQYPEKIIPFFIQRLLDNQTVPIYGNGQNIRDWIHVEDNCRAIKLILDKGQPGQIYNIGGGNQVTNLMLTGMLLDLLNKDASFIEFVPDRLGHDLRYDINSRKLKELGWQPSYQFKDGLAKTVEWYCSNIVSNCWSRP
jgi:dTDP-glucose 4,6-dehydratase